MIYWIRGSCIWNERIFTWSAENKIAMTCCDDDGFLTVSFSGEFYIDIIAGWELKEKRVSKIRDNLFVRFKK